MAAKILLIIEKNFLNCEELKGTKVERSMNLIRYLVFFIVVCVIFVLDKIFDDYELHMQYIGSSFLFLFIGSSTLLMRALPQNEDTMEKTKLLFIEKIGPILNILTGLICLTAYWLTFSVSPVYSNIISQFCIEIIIMVAIINFIPLYKKGSETHLIYIVIGVLLSVIFGISLVAEFIYLFY